TGQPDQSELLQQQALKIREAKLGPADPKVAESLAGLALLHAGQDQPTQAAKEYQGARQIVRKLVAQVLPLFSPKEQLDFLEHKDRKDFHDAMTLGWQSHDQQAIAAQSA